MKNRIVLTVALSLSLTLFSLVGLQESQAQVDYLRKAAEQGDPKAQAELGRKYALGRDVPRDTVEAVKWFRKAAEHGLPRAQYDLGLSDATGQCALPHVIIRLRPSAVKKNIKRLCGCWLFVHLRGLEDAKFLTINFAI